MENIISICLDTDFHAVTIYNILASYEEDPDIKAFWIYMSKEESNHVEYWKNILQFVRTRNASAVIEYAEDVEIDLKNNLDLIMQLESKLSKKTSRKESLQIAFRLEYFLLFPSFAHLMNFVDTVVGENPLRDEYDSHINEFLDKMNQWAGFDEDLKMLSSMVTRLWQVTNRRMQELEESIRLKNLFIDIIEHDVMNPTSIINMMSEDLLEGASETQKKFIDGIRRNIEKQIELINGAKELSKLSSINKLSKEKVNLKTIIDRAVELVKQQYPDVNMPFSNRISEDVYVMANYMLQDVFVNLFTNSVKYALSDDGVIIEASHDETVVKVRIVDNGPGIPDNYKIQVFQRFKKVEKEGVEGSGLGLAIVKRILELHNGSVKVEDNPMGGAVFVIELPVE